MPHHSWTEKEILFLKKHYPLKSAAWIAQKLGKTTGQVKGFAANHKLYRENFRMNETCALFIRENIESLSYQEIASALNLPVNKIKTFIYRNKLVSNPYRPYTHSEIQTIEANYHNLSNGEIGAIINRSDDSVKNKMANLNFKRTNEDLQNLNSRLASPTWFSKGMTSHNKKLNGYTSVRIDSKGNPYRYIKMAQGGFELLHRYNWEQKHGPIPVDKILRSVDGNQLNCDPDNWELIDRAGHLDKNAGRSELTDAYVVSKLSARQPELKDDLRKMPELIELKRNQIKLRRTINELDEIAGNDK